MDYNLFDVDKRHPSKEQVEMDCFSALDEYAKDYQRSFRHYFLNYGPESFTKFHTFPLAFIPQLFKANGNGWHSEQTKGNYD